jgi:hypothetical protein
MKHTIRYLLIGELLLTIVADLQIAQSAENHTHADQTIVSVAESNYARAKAVVEHHKAELQKVDGVHAIGAGTNEIVIEVTVYTNQKGEKPATLPRHLQALPSTIEGMPVRLFPMHVLPPPPGVIILKPGGKREKADSCPAGYDETSYHGWRFCYAHGNPETIPGVMMPPIAGIPREEAFKILDRHREKLRAIRGVGTVGMGANGIYIESPDPSLLPKEVEGLPLEIHPVLSGEAKNDGHTVATTVRPLRGGIGISGRGTLAAMGYNSGLWLIFPAHLMDPTLCGTSPVCTQPLNECLERYKNTNTKASQPASGANSLIGQIVRWIPDRRNTSTYDVAAAFMDNDGNQGNSSLCADQTINEFGYWSGLDVDESTLVLNQELRMYTVNNPHVKILRFQSANSTKTNVDTNCIPVGQVTKIGQAIYTYPNRDNQGGDSGSPVLTLDGRLVAMHTWSQDQGSNPSTGGGTMGKNIKSALGFSKWYGTATFPNNPSICQ